MTESLTLATAITLLIDSTPVWLNSIRDALLNKGANFTVDRGLKLGSNWLHIDEKEQLKHLKRVLQNAAERCVGNFSTQEERDQLKHILVILSEPGTYNDALRTEVMRLFTLFDSPNFETLSELYNHALRFRTLTQPTAPKFVDAKPYLSSFFEALKEELYSDSMFREQISDAIKIRTNAGIQRSLTEVVETLHLIGGALTPHYTTEQFEQDLEAYVSYIERTLRHLKLVGVAPPKDRGSENTDPDLDAIFVPLRVAPQDRSKLTDEVLKDKTLSYITDFLEHFPCMVLLGGPGSGKSTSTRHLAWCHAAVHLHTLPKLSTKIPLLSNKPLPLRIELRRLAEDRRQLPDYDFLDYVTEVSLKRSGIHVHRQMFEVLLERKLMLILFDGLDEVATLDDRRRLIEEIEDFVQCYDANRFLVTSRPVGYELARFSNESFTHVLVREFDDQQIRIFLERWYAHVLRLSPLPSDERQELETFYTTLKENPRLHTLAANPLLLTVITSLHRHERLPDKRILVYDRCADLLLDTWAKLKGTDVRWKDMKTSTDDQRACVAHLGFVLHERSQENEVKQEAQAQKASSFNELANDVSARFILREIENYIKTRGLLSEVAEQHIEAKRFLELMQIEAGLIVERGKDESGENLYGFVHRTFQEYFAALDIYERYLQEEEPTIISQFLKEHVHDPHWHEVILLLLGKLKRKPATAQLLQLLDGKSRLSRYANIVQQDLFFACTCLAEEIAIDNELAKSIALRISDLVKYSPFPTQRTKALESLASLMRTRQYANLGQRELKILVTQDVIPDISTRIRAARILYENSTSKLDSENQRQATHRLVELAWRSDLNLEQSVQVAQALYGSSPSGSEEQQQATEKLSQLLQLTDLTPEQTVRVAQALYGSSPSGSEMRQQATEKLSQLLQRSDLTFEQSVQVAQAFYRCSSVKSREERLATEKLSELLQRPNLTFEQSLQVAQTLFFFVRTNQPKAQWQAIEKLSELLQQPDLTPEQIIQITRALYYRSPYQSEERQQATKKLSQLLQQPDLNLEHSVWVAQALCYRSPYQSEERQQAAKKLSQLLQRPDLTLEHSVRTAGALCYCSPSGSEERRLAIGKLNELLQRPDLTPEQSVRASEALCYHSPYQSEERRLTTEKLNELLQRPDLTPEHSVQVAQALYRHNPSKSEEQLQAAEKLVELARRSDLSFEQNLLLAQALNETDLYELEEAYQTVHRLSELASESSLTVNQSIQLAQVLCERFITRRQPEVVRLVIQKLTALAQQSDVTSEQNRQIAKVLFRYIDQHFEDERWVTQRLVELLQRPDLTPEQHVHVARALYYSSTSGSKERRLATEKLSELFQRSDLTFEQIVHVAWALYNTSPSKSEEERLATEKLSELLQRPDLTLEQSVQVAQSLYKSSSSKSEEERLATEKLSELLQRPDLTFEQSVQVARALYYSSTSSSEERSQASQQLWHLAQKQDIPIELRLQIIAIPLKEGRNNYPDQAQAVQLVISMMQGEAAKHFLEENWQPIETSGSKHNVDASDLPFIAELANQEMLPTSIRDEMYRILNDMVPKFGDMNEYAAPK